MKRKAILVCAVLMMALTTLFAASNFTITDFSMDVQVDDSNVLAVTETIQVFFATPSHGIFQTVPVIFGNKKVKLSNIRSSSKLTRDDVTNAYVTFRIGDADKLVSGSQTYVISFDYAIGDDHNSAYDELYYDLLGTSWETDVDNFRYSVTMPHAIDDSKVWVVQGREGSTAPGSFSVSPDKRTVTGQARNLGNGKGLNLRIELPEGYFSSVTKDKDASVLCMALALVFSALAIFVAWRTFSVYGRDDLVVPVVRFDAPEDLSPMDVGYLVDGTVDAKDLSSMLFYWADKGYLTITIPDKKFFQRQDYVFTKLKDPENASVYEKTFFDAFFACGTQPGVVRITEMKDTRFPAKVQTVKNLLVKRFTHGASDMRDETAEKKKALVMVLAFVLLAANLVLAQKAYPYGDVFTALPFGILSVAFTLICTLFVASRWLTAKKAALVTVSIVCVVCVIWFTLGAVMGLERSQWSGAKAIAMGLCVSVFPALVVAISSFVGKRSAFGVKAMGQILGYREFIATAKMDQLKMMIDKNPLMYYHVLCYAIVYGLEKKWAKKFESITVEQPSWYYGPGDMLFNAMVLDSMVDAVSDAVLKNLYAQSTSSSHGGVHSSSGFSGSVGGGFGGGGGGSW